MKQSVKSNLANEQLSAEEKELNLWLLDWAVRQGTHSHLVRFGEGIGPRRHVEVLAVDLEQKKAIPLSNEFRNQLSDVGAAARMDRLEQVRTMLADGPKDPSRPSGRRKSLNESVLAEMLKEYKSLKRPLLTDGVIQNVLLAVAEAEAKQPSKNYSDPLLVDAAKFLRRPVKWRDFVNEWNKNVDLRKRYKPRLKRRINRATR